MGHKKATHGGNIYKKARELHIKEEDILDFSSNLSPLGIPDGVRKRLIRSVDGMIHYPDPDCEELKKAIAEYEGVKSEQILCGNGGADLLFRLAFGCKPRKVLLPVPAFVEYEEALRAADAEIVYHNMDEDLRLKEDVLEAMKEDQDLLVICNPNNPTGLLTDRTLIRKILKKAEKLKIRVLLDECFLDLFPGEEDYTLKHELEAFPNLIILKSFTKMYAIPGVRLGYLLSSDKTVLERASGCGQAWSVSHFAQEAGIAALQETEYRQKTIDMIGQENKFMKEALRKLPVRLYDGVVNYLFFRVPGDKTLDRRLEQYGIMIRNCSNYQNLSEDYFRVAVRTHDENVRLLEALSKELGGKE